METRQSLLEDALFPKGLPPPAPQQVAGARLWVRLMTAAILVSVLLSAVWTLWLGYGLVALMTEFFRWWVA